MVSIASNWEDNYNELSRRGCLRNRQTVTPVASFQTAQFIQSYRFALLTGKPTEVNIPNLTMATIVSLPFEENTYILRIAERDDCLVVDPGLQPEKIIDHLERDGLTPAAILNTHGHSDHIAGNAAMKHRWPEAPLVIGSGDAAMLTDADLNLSAAYGVSIISPEADGQLEEGETYSAAGFDLLVRTIPGHSPGHIVFVWQSSHPQLVIGGDVLFAGGIGRTDFPGGSFEALEAGIHQKLFILPDDTIVLPGHGPTTTIGHEKQTNPFVGVPAGYRP